MRTRARFLVTLVLVATVLTASSAFAQPYAWTITRGLLTGTQLSVMNLASTERVSAVSVPSSIGLAGATITADGADYLISTSLGIVRFGTETRAIEGVFGPPVAGRLSAAGDELHLVSSGTYYVLNATTGEILAQRSVAPVFQVVFSPDTSVRYELEAAQGATETTVRATSAQTDQLLWQQTVTGLHGSHVAAGANDIALDVVVGGTSKLVVLAAATGSERARLDVAVQGLDCCRDNSLFVSTTGPIAGTGTATFRLVSVDLSTLTQSVVLEVPGLVAFGAPLDVVLSSDRSVAYWLTFTAIKLALASTTYRAVDLATGEVLSTGSVSGQVDEIAVQPGVHCRFNLTTAATIGPEGGTLEIPVTPSASCDPWGAQSLAYGAVVVNPGPHLGPATLRITVVPTSYLVPAPIEVYVLGRTIHITQTGAPPAAPEVSASIVEGRAVVSWTVRTGAAPTQFLVRGGVRGGAKVPLVTVFAEIRSWTSDPLPPGSYAVDVVARNFGGESVPSNQVELSVGVTTTPEPPVNVTATSADDVVSVSWSAAPAGPAPSGYLIEAVPTGAVAFVPVLRVESTRAYASGVPAGTWQVRVRALTAAGASGPSNIVTITSAPCTAPPGPPTDVQVMPVAGVFTLRWGAPATGGVHDYIIDAGRVSGGSAGRAQIPVGGFSQVYELPAPNGIYSARVRARNACGESAASNEVIAYIP